ncbi:MAG: hypothetical protein JW913_01065 [Chitinispirillaceae bacterium]|nr:hypothetical protein [Chitinispirillaceae bacterium]
MIELVKPKNIEFYKQCIEGDMGPRRKPCAEKRHTGNSGAGAGTTRCIGALSSATKGRSRPTFFSCLISVLHIF